jgi:hypothetical protein
LRIRNSGAPEGNTVPDPIVSLILEIINKRNGNTEGTIKRNWQHRVHNTKKNATKYTQTNTNNINKTCIILPTTRDKDELNIVFMQK